MSQSSFSYFNDQLTLELTIRNYSPDTLRHYTYHVGKFFAFIDYSEAALTEEQVRAYLFDIRTNSSRSLSYLNTSYSAVKFLFIHVLKLDWSIKAIPRPKPERTLPQVLSTDDIVLMIQLTKNLKHKAMLSTAYSAGLRVSELVNLKVSDIHSSNMQILVSHGKGRKDRYTLLSENNLILLRTYFRGYKPTQYLFENERTRLPLTTRTAQAVFNAALIRANIHRDLTFHTLRHSFATHMILAGVDIFFIQKLLGHASIETTSIYLHVLNKELSAIKSPLDNYMGGNLI